MGENVGAAARAMKNFGLKELVLIAPKMDWPNDKAQMLAEFLPFLVFLAKGWVEPHSSSMKRSGICGESSMSAVAASNACGAQSVRRRSPNARLPI